MNHTADATVYAREPWKAVGRMDGRVEEERLRERLVREWRRPDRRTACWALESLGAGYSELIAGLLQDLQSHANEWMRMAAAIELARALCSCVRVDENDR
jgi:hypothetical protein